ncbi:unnamed protein product [Caenorhabditis brenneri]
MSHEILEIPLLRQPASTSKRKVEICMVNGRFFASKSDSAYLETEAHVCIDRSSAPSSSTTDPAPNKKSKNWHENSNFLPILDELVAVLVEFGFADVFQNSMDSGSMDPGGSGSTSSESWKKRILKVHEIPFEDSKTFRTKRLVVRDFWKRGYFIADGCRFGGDYLVYTASPNQCHAEFVILCSPESDLQRISAMRCCNQVKKTLIVATSSAHSPQPHYTKCEWFRPEMF